MQRVAAGTVPQAFTRWGGIRIDSVTFFAGQHFLHENPFESSIGPWRPHQISASKLSRRNFFGSLTSNPGVCREASKLNFSRGDHHSWHATGQGDPGALYLRDKT